MDRHPLCSVPYCPAPTDPDAHVCPHCKGIEVQHQHVEPRGMGGSPSRRDDPRNVVMICPALHEEITLHRLSDGFVDVLGRRIYRVWDIHNETICEYAPYWVQGGSAAGDTAFRAVVESTPVSAEPLPLFQPLPPGLAYEDWRQHGIRLSLLRDQAAWAIAEWVAYGEREYGEKYSDALNDTGLSYDRLTNIVSTAGAFKEISRARELAFGVAEAIAPVARQSALEGRETVERAIAERWSVEQARAEVKALRAPDGYEAPEQHECPECHHKHRRKA